MVVYGQTDFHEIVERQTLLSLNFRQYEAWVIMAWLGQRNPLHIVCCDLISGIHGHLTVPPHWSMHTWGSTAEVVWNKYIGSILRNWWCDFLKIPVTFGDSHVHTWFGVMLWQAGQEIHPQDPIGREGIRSPLCTRVELKLSLYTRLAYQRHVRRIHNS